MSSRDYSPKLLTAEHLYSVPDDAHRYELHAGWLRVFEPPGYEHGAIALTLGGALAHYVRTQRLGEAVTESGFVLQREPDVVYGPDVAFVRAERTPRRKSRERFFEGAPDLAVEIVSPSNTADDVAKKVTRYLAAGTRLVWVVAPRSKTVTVHRPGAVPATLTVPAALDGSDVVPGFTLPLDLLFREGD